MLSKRRNRNWGNPYGMDDDDDYTYYGAREAFSEAEIAAAQPQPVAPRELLAQLLGMEIAAVRALLWPTIYEIRIAAEDGKFVPMYGWKDLKRTRINVYLEDNKVVNAFVG